MIARRPSVNIDIVRCKKEKQTPIAACRVSGKSFSSHYETCDVLVKQMYAENTFLNPELISMSKLLLHVKSNMNICI